jgi:putative oxidoreductase
MNHVCQIVQKYGPFIARLLLAQLFIISGVGKIGGFAGTAAFMAGAGLPLASVLLLFTIALEVGGGILLVLGWQVRWVATAFFCFTFLTAVIFHPFWNSDPASVFGQMNNFMKNLAIMGGMLYVVAYGAGPLSLGGAGREPDAARGKTGPPAARKRKT